MSNNKRPSLVRQVQQVYRGKLAIGESRHAAKADGTASGKIFSYGTYHAYMKRAILFTRYCKELHGCRTLEECRPYIGEYIRSRSHLSAWTLADDRTALAKLYGCPGAELCPVPAKHRSDIRSSRGSCSFFSEERNAEIVTFARATGLRRRELSMVRGTQLNRAQSGLPYLRGIRGKGGRIRNVPVLESCLPEVERLCGERGGEKLFPRIPVYMPVQKYRAEYATAMYRLQARDVSRLSRKEIYVCRKDMAGVTLDRKAMRYVSECLGHSRIDVIAQSYLYRLAEENGPEDSVHGPRDAYDMVKEFAESRPGGFTFRDAADGCPRYSPKSISAPLKKLTDEGILLKKGSGNQAYYVPADHPEREILPRNAVTAVRKFAETQSGRFTRRDVTAGCPEYSRNRCTFALSALTQEGFLLRKASRSKTFYIRAGLPVRDDTPRSVYDALKEYAETGTGRFRRKEAAARYPQYNIKSFNPPLRKLVEEGFLVKMGSGTGTFYVRSDLAE